MELREYHTYKVVTPNFSERIEVHLYSFLRLNFVWTIDDENNEFLKRHGVHFNV